jgi:glycosyltransferase involved in cell wall biosynthesis
MDKPIISIIVPVYKVEQYLDRCVKSLINQTFEDIEIILVNDGSPDNCPAMCDEYAKEDKRIRVIHKKNGGLSDARNAGLHSSTGLYIMFVDSDDYIENNACEELVGIVENHKVDMVVGAAKKIIGSDIKKMVSSKMLHNSVLTGREYLKHELKYNYARMAVWLNLYRREFLIGNNLFLKVGLLHEDEQWTPRVFLEASYVYVSDIYFYNYIIRQNSISKSKAFFENAEHIKATVRELHETYNSIDDYELKLLLNNYLIGLYLFAYSRSVTDISKEEYLSIKKIIKTYARGRKNRLKGLLFSFNPSVYKSCYKLKTLIRGS